MEKKRRATDKVQQFLPGLRKLLDQKVLEEHEQKKAPKKQRNVKKSSPKVTNGVVPKEKIKRKRKGGSGESVPLKEAEPEVEEPITKTPYHD
jgi:hypothetical protein